MIKIVNDKGNLTPNNNFSIEYHYFKKDIKIK
jgi:hypothetical protein